MPNTIAIRTVAIPAGLACASATGAWLGFSSCGGYVWHTYVGYALLALAVFVVSASATTPVKRAALALVVIATFLVARGVGFALYLGAETPGEYLRQVSATFGAGLC